MKKWMKDDEFVPFAPSFVGKTRHNHESPDCSGGRDSMLVERKSDGSIAAYCFRCGSIGLNSPVRYRRTYASSSGGARAIGDDAGDGGSGYAKGWRSLPSDSGKDYPALVVRWLLAGGFDSKLCAKYGVVYSERTESLYIPVLRSGDIAGYAMRKFEPKTYRPMTDNFSKFFGWMRGNTDKVVLVEDILSCYRVHEAGFDAIALMGTEIKDGVVAAVQEGRYKEAVVFLDADNPTVRMKARRIAKRLAFTSTRVLETGKDPKRHTEEQLKCLLT